MSPSNYAITISDSWMLEQWLPVPLKSHQLLEQATGITVGDTNAKGRGDFTEGTEEEELGSDTIMKKGL